MTPTVRTKVTLTDKICQNDTTVIVNNKLLEKRTFLTIKSVVSVAWCYIKTWRYNPVTNFYFLIFSPLCRFLRTKYQQNGAFMFSGLFLWMCSASERRRYNVTSSLIGWAHAQKDPCGFFHLLHQRWVCSEIGCDVIKIWSQYFL